MVPNNLNGDQKARRKEVSAEMLEWFENEPELWKPCIRIYGVMTQKPRRLYWR
jgi:hypothetical protein